MIYRVLYDGVDIHTNSLPDVLINPTVETEMNTAGSFSFTLPPDHFAWGDIEVFKGNVDIYENDELIFFGRVANVDQNWNNERIVECEGALAFFNDSIQRPNSWTSNTLISQFLSDILDAHNAQVPDNRKIYLGNVTIDDMYVTRETNYEKTLDVLTRMCIDTNGGYFSLRKDEDDGKIYLDWLKDLTDIAAQPVEFGLNLLDISKSLHAEDIVTGVLARGAEVNDVKIDLHEVGEIDDPSSPVIHHTNQDPDILWHREGLENFGRVVRVKEFNDCETVDGDNGLLAKATEWLVKQNTDVDTIEVDAAELGYFGESYPIFLLGQKVTVNSTPHGLSNVELPMYKISMNLDSGTKRISIGTPPKRELTQISASNMGGGSGSGSSSGGGSGSSGVQDVRVNGTSVVQDGIARVNVPTDTVTESEMNTAISTAVSGKANQSDLESLATTVAGKASQADLNALSTTVAGKQDQLTPGTGIEITNNVISATGGGGTTVEANPSDPATDDLNTIKIGNTVYDIPGGGGGGSYTAGSHIDISNNEISVSLHDDSPLTPSEFDYTGDVQTYTVPYDAIYKLQVWGASGGDGTDGRSHAGYGGYTEGKILLTAGEVLYIYVGQAGVGGSSGGDSVRFNGGGKANHSGSWSRGSGGGATHIAKVSGLLSSLDQNVNDILVVAGGGGGAGYYSGNEYGTGGSGGGYIGGNGVRRVSGTAGTGATQQAGGTGVGTGSFGKGADKSDTSDYGGSGGGGGFYGGGSSANTSGAGGGSGYYNPNLTDACMYGYEVSESSGSSNKTVSVSEYYTDPVPQVAKSGNGYAIITCLGTTGTDLITRETMEETIEEAIEEAKFNNLTMMSDYYSEEEQVVGRWTDGKPLYQKTYIWTNTELNQWVNHDVSDINIDTMVDIKGWLKRIANGQVILIHPIGYEERTNNAYSAQCRYTATNNTIDVYNALPSGNSSDQQVITIQYTKTTDAPGTGPTKGNLIYLPALYSEEEREVGVWTDGKPVYQKSYRYDNTSSQTVYVDVSSLNIDRLVLSNLSTGMGTPQNQVAGNWYMSGYDYGNCYFNTVSNNIEIRRGTDWEKTANGVMTIQYTKTTDQPGSGTWTPEGQLAHHYSTSEKIVGTWIDGSTVYERMVILSTPLYINSNEWASNIIDLQGQKIVKIDAYNPDDYVMPIMGGFLNGVLEVCNFRPSRITVDKFIIQYTKSS